MKRARWAVSRATLRLVVGLPVDHSLLMEAFCPTCATDADIEGFIRADSVLSEAVMGLGLRARLVTAEAHPETGARSFWTGFGVHAKRQRHPDTGLVWYGKARIYRATVNKVHGPWGSSRVFRSHRAEWRERVRRLPAVFDCSTCHEQILVDLPAWLDKPTLLSVGSGHISE